MNVVIDPKSARDCFALGAGYARKRMYKEAAALMGLALQHFEPEALWLASYAGVLQCIGEHAFAVRLYERAIARGYESLVVWTNLAEAKLETLDDGGALTALEKALALDPSGKSAAARRARALALKLHARHFARR